MRSPTKGHRHQAKGSIDPWRKKTSSGNDHVLDPPSSHWFLLQRTQRPLAEEEKDNHTDYCLAVNLKRTELALWTCAQSREHKSGLLSLLWLPLPHPNIHMSHINLPDHHSLCDKVWQSQDALWFPNLCFWSRTHEALCQKWHLCPECIPKIYLLVHPSRWLQVLADMGGQTKAVPVASLVLVIQSPTGSELREEGCVLAQGLRIQPIMVRKYGPWGQKCASETPPHVSTSEETESRKYWHVPGFLLCRPLLFSVDSWSIDLCCLYSGKVPPAQLIIFANSVVAMPRSWVDNEKLTLPAQMNSRVGCIKHYGDCVQLLENTSALLLQGLGYSEALSGMHLPAVTFLITNGLWGLVAGEDGHKMSYPQVILDLLMPR